MTQIEIVDLLKESGVWDEIGYPTSIDKLIDLVAAHEKKFWMEQIEVECNEAVLAERDRMCKQFNIPMELANETAASNEAD